MALARLKSDIRSRSSDQYQDELSDEDQAEESRPGRCKSDLTKRRWDWLEWFGMLTGPTAIDLKVAIRLAHYAGLSRSWSSFARTGIVSCDPSVETLARALAVCERSIRNSLARLENRFDAIKIDHSGGGRTQTNTYVLPTRNPAKLLATFSEDESMGTGDQKHGRSDQKRGKSDTGNVARALTNESLPKGRSRGSGVMRRAAHPAQPRGARRGARPQWNSLPAVDRVGGLLDDRDVISACRKAIAWIDPDDLAGVEKLIDVTLDHPGQERSHNETIPVLSIILWKTKRGVASVLRDVSGPEALCNRMLEQSDHNAGRCFQSHDELVDWLCSEIVRRRVKHHIAVHALGPDDTCSHPSA